MLIIFGGLPATGKTTLARALCQRIRAIHLRIDTIEQAIRASSMLKAEVGPAGYLVGYAIAADNLRIGRTVVADSVNPLAITRDAWKEVAVNAHVPWMEVEIVCSDAAAHRNRIETRTTDVPGLRLPSWSDVMAREYEPWDRRHIIVDTAAKSPDAALEELLRAGGWTGRTDASQDGTVRDGNP